MVSKIADPGEVGDCLAADWADGCEDNTLDQLVEAIHAFARRLALMAEIIHGDDGVPRLTRAFREAADGAEMDFGVRVAHGDRLMKGLWQTLKSKIRLSTRRSSGQCTRISGQDT